MHKAQQLKKFRFLVGRRDLGDREAHFFTKHNYKKNTAEKSLYSCSGYGGKCHNCKSSPWGKDKKNVKQSIVYGDSEISIIVR